MTAVAESIEYIDDAVNGIECIGDGKFTVTTLIGIIIDNHNEAKENSDA